MPVVLTDLGGAGVVRGDDLATALLARSETGLVALDAAGRIAMANGAAFRVLDLEGAPSFAAALPPGCAATFEQWRQTGAVRELVLPLDDGCVLTVAAAPGPGGHLLLTIGLGPPNTVPHDRRDPLTGLADRAWLLERLATALVAPGADPALLIIDLDRFASVNDVHGHGVGDALLQVAAKRLRGALRDADVICRFAGDAFAIAMKRPTDALSMARRLVTLLSRPYLIEGATLPMGASAGVALAPEHGTDAAALVRAAHVALHAAKQAGGPPAVVYADGMQEAAQERHRHQEALRLAMKLGQLELHFQPQLALAGEELTGFEAFARWHHPDGRLLTADQFIPLADETGLIWPLTEWVLRSACEEAIGWPAALTVAVNVSARQLLDQHRLPRLIKRVLLRTGLAPHRLEIEIAESALVQEAETMAVLHALDAMGVRVSLDDFGTGAATLTHLRRLKLHRLKIDRSLIHALGSSEDATTLVRTIAALGRTLGIVTIAEGVETAAQRAEVREDGCTEIQGHVLSEPVPAREVARLIATMQPYARFPERIT